LMIHAPSQSVLLNAPDPLAIREILPKSKLIDAPQFNIAVKHTLESVKVLRNLGHAIPAPINTSYVWPGKYTPFDHQRVMAEFLTLNRRAFNLSEMGCVSGDTEFLSPSGWVRMDEYAGQDVAQYWPETGQMDFVKAPKYVKLPCETMVHICTDKGVDQLLSMEHRVLLVSTSTGRNEVLSAHELWQRHHRWLNREPSDGNARDGKTVWSRAAIPTSCTTTGGAGINLSDAELRVQVAAIADGHFSRRTNWCVIRLKKDRKKDRLRHLLRHAEIQHKETEAADGFTVFRFYAPWRTKVFDCRFWAATYDQLHVIVDEVCYWDGSRQIGKAPAFFTSERESADFIQYAASTSGGSSRLRCYERERRGRVEREYVVRLFREVGLSMLISTSSKGDRHPVMRLVDAPDGHKYCFMVPSTFLVLRRNGCVFMSGNTGKTASTLWATDWLMLTGRIKKALILSPLSTMDRVWRNDCFDVLMHRVVSVVYGSKEKRLEALDVDADIYIMNHDGLGIKDVASAIRKRPDINLVIVDEASMFRNHHTKKYKALKDLIRPDMRLWLLTGTPCPNAPTDAWALAKLISPERVPEFYGSFRRQTMMQISQFKWAPRHDAYEIAYGAMQPAVRFKKSECLDLPDVVHLDRQAMMTPEQRKAFDGMRTLMQAEAKESQITAVNAADKINKIRQILCGSVKDPTTGDYVHIPHQARTDVLLECIEQASAKVLVVVPFKGIIGELEKELSKHYSVGVLNGDVSPKRRDQIIKDFKSGPDPHLLLCHPKVMAHGLNLTEADTLIFYAPIYSNDEYQQVTERFNRTGQTHKMTIVRIAAHPIEWEIYKLVDSKKLTQDNILALYKSVTD
jgi:hypothetical protein